ncbi:MAG: prepilin-type N-terminal cleavage/methylation domain-containing protein [Candidatus Pacebacteria bacterium]|nr:prepilin-type N-terminal cleavage/methylation domain-containing protein [Candidatus Paceibacterota bacterium]MCF7862999.1 prepilin-type N-terminal cleavage/methylation domain-containing protein [Candidatus Paceibacterota bacterium]
MNKKGFTLIELLVVVAIIGVLSSVVIGSVNKSRVKARDTQRWNDIVQIQNALELYYSDFGHYPKRFWAQTTGVSGGCLDGNSQWCDLQNDLTPYGLKKISDPQGVGNYDQYYYRSTVGDNYQTYGFMLRFEDSANIAKQATDGGYSASYYEVGQRPRLLYDKIS